MSKLIGTELPQTLLQKLSGAETDSHRNKAIVICSVDSAGWAHPAMLSYFEVVAIGRANIRLAIYKNSSTAANIRRNGKLTILIVDRRMAYYVKGSAAELAHEMASAPHNSIFSLRVEQVLADSANEEFEPGVYIAGGITYERPRPSQEREILNELLK
jgi:hypothetical protein